MNISRREMLSKLLLTWMAGSMPGRLLGSMSEVLRYRPTDTGPGRKFSATGVAQRFPGNTILCHLNRPGRQFDSLRQVVDVLRASTGDDNITWLPPSSYHMTVFDGSLDSKRQSGDWPDGVPLTASLDDCSKFIVDRLRSFDLGFEPPIRMVADEQLLGPTQTCFPLRPIDKSENRRMRDLRDRLAKALGIHHQNHDDYVFHISFGYYIRAFGESAQEAYSVRRREAIAGLRRMLPVIELSAPEFCRFDDMTSFQTEFVMKARTEA
jgi:hypothetical protein